MQTYFMVGAGGTGTHLLPALLAYLRNYHTINGTDYQVVIADGDNFDQANATRQLFADGLVAVNKAEAMLTMFPGHPIIAVSRFIGRVDVENMIQDGDCVLICADNYSVRALIAERVALLDKAVVINAGNEVNSGSVQLWVQEGGENKTPPITYGHPEIQYLAEDDRAPMTCAQVAAMPGGGQTIMANMTAATYMLVALQRWHSGAYARPSWTELQFDLEAGAVEHIDMRLRRNWA